MWLRLRLWLSGNYDANRLDYQGMKSPLYIFGAAGFAAETALIALETGLYEMAGFVEADSVWMPDRTAMELKPGVWVPVIQETQLKDSLIAAPRSGEPEACGAIAIANPEIARAIAGRFEGLLTWPSIIHRDARTDSAAAIGKGNICYPGVIISWRARVGDFNKFQAYVTIGHECRIGDFNEFNPRATVSGNVTVGNDCLIGASASIRQGLEIGSGATVGMGAVVIRNVDGGTIVAGNPAKEIEKR